MIYRSISALERLSTGESRLASTVDPEKDIFALMYSNPPVVKMADGSYKIKPEKERQATTVTAVIESPTAADHQLLLADFIAEFPHLGQKVRCHLVMVGLRLVG